LSAKDVDIETVFFVAKILEELSILVRGPPFMPLGTPIFGRSKTRFVASEILDVAIASGSPLLPMPLLYLFVFRDNSPSSRLSNGFLVQPITSGKVHSFSGLEVV
jgi:hypothetical protein